MSFEGEVFGPLGVICRNMCIYACILGRRTPTILNFSQGSVPHKHIPALGESLSSPTAVCTGTRQETGLSSWTGRWPMASGTGLLVGLLGQLEKGLS